MTDRRTPQLCVAAGAALLPAQLALVAWMTLSVVTLVVGAVVGSPAERVAGSRISSMRIEDRDGELLRETLGEHDDRGRWVTLDEVSEHLPAALIAAEDRRFSSHTGVDSRALGRAMTQNIAAGRVVSGGSTLTQQLVKITTGRMQQRTVAVKLLEMASALHYERHLTKDQILEGYINWVPLGHLTRGVEMASQTYFGKPAAHLTLAESAALAALVRGPGMLDPYSHPDKLEIRRRWVLTRMLDNGFIDADQLDHASAHPPVFHEPSPVFEAPHLSEEILARTGRDRLVSGRVTTTLDLTLQNQAETLATAAVDHLGSVDVTNASVVVIDNATGQVRAWVGSSGYFDVQAQGMNDGVTALRSPGSALKPFVYGEALRSGYTPATLLEDVPTSFFTPEGPYRPHNYDGLFRGPVLLRQALGSSLNVPAVAVAADLGPAKVLDTLNRAGFDSLDEDASHYGAAIALGDGEVTLLELASAYSMIARGGTWIEPVLVSEVVDATGSSIPVDAPQTRTVFDPSSCFLITSILSDPAARAPAFGDARVFDLGFSLAVKTGTSHDYRDNWAVGFTPEVTVAVWVGNFDGQPMGNVSGITGAGPLFSQVLLAATEGSTHPEFFPPASVESQRVCALSGHLPGPGCDVTYPEVFVSGSAPTTSCPIHSLLADGTVVESYPESLAQWAEGAGRPAPSHAQSPTPDPGVEVSILQPSSGAIFAQTPDVPTPNQIIEVKLTAQASGAPIVLLVDGAPAGMVDRAPWVIEWVLVPGDHVFSARSAGHLSDPVSITVN